MNIKRKIIGIFMCVLMLGIIPVAAGLTTDIEPDDPEQTAVGRTIIRGFVFNYRNSGFGNAFFAIRIHYVEITGTQRTSGVIWLRPCTVGREAILGFKRDGPMGMFGYMFGATFKGGIDY